jgi:ABC-type multidrug transport system fused ATPase/permease subunit
MQRLAIARAVLRNPRVMVLDEATSNLDSVSERHVTEALNEVMKGRTTLIIAHRLSTASRADRIAVLRKGQIVEIGSFQDLLDADGVFAGMYRAYRAGALGDEIG